MIPGTYGPTSTPFSVARIGRERKSSSRAVLTASSSCGQPPPPRGHRGLPTYRRLWMAVEAATSGGWGKTTRRTKTCGAVMMMLIIMVVVNEEMEGVRRVLNVPRGKKVEVEGLCRQF